MPKVLPAVLEGHKAAAETHFNNLAACRGGDGRADGRIDGRIDGRKGARQNRIYRNRLFTLSFGALPPSLWEILKESIALNPDRCLSECGPKDLYPGTAHSLRVRDSQFPSPGPGPFPQSTRGIQLPEVQTRTS